MRTKRTIFLCAFAAFSLSGAALGVGCSGGENSASGSANTGGNSSGSSQGGGGNGQGGNGGDGGGDINFFDAGAGDGALTEDSACVSQSSEATLVKKPVDIIIVIDNSGSMGDEIVGVQNNINQNFAQIIENSGLDYRVIMIAKHGKAVPDESVCIEAPLSGIPAGGCETPPAAPVNNAGKFYHYNTEIDSVNSLCKVLSTFTTAEPSGGAPTGWQEWVRPDSFKTFIELTDDRVGCSFGGVSYSDGNTAAGGVSAAEQFDTSLLALSPEHFGTKEARNYRFYSIVAMAYNDPQTKPWEPADPITTAECPTAANPGTGYQALSVLTGGLRFPLCDTTSYDVVFQAIAEGVVAGAQVSCDFAIPDPPMGTTVDLNSVVVDYTPGDMSPNKQFKQVADVAACAPESFYIDKDAKKIILCPDTCGVVKNDAAAKIAVLFACDPGGAN
ncbi:hypothetical protein [Polyangium jinanense]|uniref:VWFA domain-containing protein n=1 Tax=Polyangium jinanense TaxID=2829994 RepID=A0A9X4ARY0_9BACT|nr:hypothetical protein [Polyangium jinanense]MDC3953014.1 hypothetical protein [Polyangium jinanense]MDC3980632.1 hypothetical protein [Polyangium jinanense]